MFLGDGMEVVWGWVGYMSSSLCSNIPSVSELLHHSVLFLDTNHPVCRKRAEYGFGEYGFKHRTQWVFWGSLSSGERTQWVPLSLLFVCPKRTHRVFRRTHRVCPQIQWVLFSETVLSKQYSRNSIPPVSYFSGSAKMGETKREKRQLVEDFRTFLQIWSLTCKVSRLEPQKTAENRRKPQETEENRRKQFRPLSPI